MKRFSLLANIIHELSYNSSDNSHRFLYNLALEAINQVAHAYITKPNEWTIPLQADGVSTYLFSIRNAASYGELTQKRLNFFIN